MALYTIFFLKYQIKSIPVYFQAPTKATSHLESGSKYYILYICISTQIHIKNDKFDNRRLYCKTSRSSVYSHFLT